MKRGRAEEAEKTGGRKNGSSYRREGIISYEVK